jgi:hypothetical protein
MSAMTMAVADDYLRRYDQKKNPYQESSSKIWYDAKSTRIKMALFNYRLENYNAPTYRDPHRKQKPQIKRPAWMKPVTAVTRKKETTATGTNKVSKKHKPSRFNKSSVSKEELKEEEARYD